MVISATYTANLAAFLTVARLSTGSSRTLLWIRIFVQVRIYGRLQIDRDGHLDQSETYHISYSVRKYGHRN